MAKNPLIMTSIAGMGSNSTGVAVLLEQIGNIADLTTQDKSNLVSAINELDSDIAALVGGLKYKGTIGEGGTVTTLPNPHSEGWMYKVITAGTYAGESCDVGDIIICLQDGETENNADWSVVNGNVDRVVTNANTSTADHVATFSDGSGLEIKDSGYTIASNVPSNAKFTDTTYDLTAENDTSSGVNIVFSEDGTPQKMNIDGGQGIDVKLEDDKIKISSTGLDTEGNALTSYLHDVSFDANTNKITFLNGTDTTAKEVTISTIGTLSDLDTTAKTDIVSAINEVDNGLGAISSNVSAINQAIGDPSDLDTASKSTIIAAVNEVNSGLNDVKANVEDIENSEIVLLDSFLDNYTSFKNKLVLYTFDGSGWSYDERDNCAYYDSKGNYYGFDINIKMITVGEDSIIDIFSDITLNEEFFIIHYERDRLGAPQSINDLPIGDNDYYLFKDIDSNSFDLENGKYYLAAVTKYMVDGGIDPGEAGIVTVYGEIYPNAILAIENRKTEYNLKSTNTNIGTLSNLTTTDKDNLVEAINEVDADITSINEDISDINTDIGTIANLHTTEKDNLVDAINSASMEIINEIPPVSPTTPTYSQSESCTLDKNEYYCYMDLTSLSLSLNVSNETSADYISSVTFTSGETATSINYPDTIHWVTGSEDVIDGVFAPIPNRRYTLTFFTDGWVICGIVNSVEVTEDDKPNLTGVTLDPDERPGGGNSGGPSYEI